MDFTSQKVRGETPSTIAALAVAMLFAMVLAIVGAMTGIIRNDTHKGVGPEMAYDFGQALGSGAAAALFVWVILYFLHVRRKAPDRGVPHLLILMAASVLAGLSPWVLGMGLTTMAERAPSVRMTQGPQGTTVARLSGRPPASITKVAADWRAQAERERAAAESARRDVLGAGLAQGYNLSSGMSPEDMRTRLSAVRTATDQAFARQELLLGELETRVAREVRDPGQRRAALKWVTNEQNFRRERLQALSMRLYESFDETDAMIDLLIRTRGAWRVEADKIAFQNDADLAEMNRHAERLHELNWEIDQIEGDFEREVADDAD